MPRANPAKERRRDAVGLAVFTAGPGLPVAGLALGRAELPLPADLLGARDLDEGDLTRRSRQLELWRAGETTAAARSEAESAVVSNAVN